MIRHPLRFLITVCALGLLVSCGTREQIRTTVSPPPVNSNAAATESSATWSSAALDEFLKDRKEMKRAWTKFKRSEKYRLAQPSDRNLTPAAAARVRMNSPDQSPPFQWWWGAEGYDGQADFVVAIVVDPSRSDPNRYGLIVIAAPKSDGGTYKTYWAAREEDMESYLLSPASGSFFIECFRRDGTEETRALAWYRSRRKFELKTL